MGGLVRVHVPGANGPRYPRTKCWRNWLARGSVGVRVFTWCVGGSGIEELIGELCECEVGRLMLLTCQWAPGLEQQLCVALLLERP